jgi:TRAP-type C4-dicarboxylate transport system substrate-binding protein
MPAPRQRTLVRRQLLASALASLAAPAVARLGFADTPLTFKLHHAASSVSAQHEKFLSPWARRVEAESNGRIRIDIFPSMQLGGAPAELFDQVRDGTVDLVWASPSLTPGRFARIELFELPFLPSRRALVSSKALQDFAAVNLKDEFADMRPVCFSCTDRGVLHGNSPVRSIEDIRDLKIQVQTRAAVEAMRVMDAHGVIVPPGQLALALNSHIVDASLDPWHLVPSLRISDVLKTHTEFSDLSLSTTTFVLAVNKASYDRLPRELKAVIDANSGMVAAGLAGTMWDLQAATVADLAASRGDAIVTLLPDAVAHWRKATEPVAEAWIREMKEHKVDGAKLIAAARLLLAKYANEPEPKPLSLPAAELQASPQESPPADQPQGATQQGGSLPADQLRAMTGGKQDKLQPLANKPAPSPSPATPAPQPAPPAKPVTQSAPTVPAGKPAAAPPAPSQPPSQASAPPNAPPKPVTPPVATQATAPAASVQAPAAPSPGPPATPKPPAYKAPEFPL